jgi:hypothetical protein
MNGPAECGFISVIVQDNNAHPLHQPVNVIPHVGNLTKEKSYINM